MLNENELIYVMGVLCKHLATSNSVLDKRTTADILSKLTGHIVPNILRQTLYKE